MLEKIDIQFHQDWDKIRQRYQKLLDLKLKNHFEATGAGGGMFEKFDLKQFGYIIDYQTLSPGWHIWTGPSLASLLPWYEQFQQTLSELTIAQTSLSVSYSDAALHTDFKINDEQHLPHCKLNYIISSEDPNAITNVYSDDHIIKKSYKSIPNSAWLLNIDHPHEIINNGIREVLQFKFLNEFDHVLEVFKKLGPLVFK